MKTIYIKRTELFRPVQMILCNSILNVDEAFFEDNLELFQTECEECKGQALQENGEPCEECYGNGSHDNEYYQYFITDLDEYDAKKLKEWGVDIGYSEKLELNVICIGDFGTGWSAFSYSKEVADDYELESNETLERTTPY